MKGKKLLAVILLAVIFCFMVSGIGYGEIKEWLYETKMSYLDWALQKARIDCMMRNPDNFLSIHLYYDFAGIFAKSFPVYVNTKGKIYINVIDNRDLLSDKVGVTLLNLFKRSLDTIYSFIEAQATDMDTDVVAELSSKEDIPLAYFYEGEYHLWKE